MTETTLNDDPLLGTEIGRYRLSHLLGEGGMGRVYLAIQPMIGSRVAIKVLSDQCARNPELLERFFAEARAVNLIHHESIVNVLDMSMLPDGRPYIVMEFVEGTTLADAVRNGPVPLGGLVQITTEVCAALAAAHAIGIVHRDLKPDNVLVTGEGHAKVLDFGIAKLAPDLHQGLSPRTQTGALLGTPHYMAPEQITGKGQIDARTDVYAAGVMLYEAIAGRRPFEGETLYDLMRAHLELAPPPLRTLRGDLPPAIEHVVLTAMAKRPEDRFQSVTALAQALQQAAAVLPPEAWRPVSSRGGLSPLISRSGSRSVPPPQDFAHRPTVAATTNTRRRRLWLIAALLSIVAIAVILIAIQQGKTETIIETAPVVAKTEPPLVTTPAPAPAPAPAGPAPVEPPPTRAMPHESRAPKPQPEQPKPAPTIDKEEAAKHGVNIHDNVTLGPGVTIGGGSGGVISTPPKPGRTSKPIDYDPKHFDATAYAPKALALARAVYPDVGFVRFDMVNVYPDGHADLTLTDDTASYLFRSPSHSARPTDVPANLPVAIACYVEVTVGPKEIEVRARGMDPTDPNCKWPIRRLPTCTVAAVWTQAKVKGAKPNTIAKVAFLEDGKWFFDNEYAHEGIVESFVDRCP